MSTDAEFVRSVLYFYKEKGDPTRYSYWDRVRCMQLMPAFHRAWTDWVIAEGVLDAVARDAYDKLED